MSIFNKIREKITKTSQAVNDKVDGVFANFHKLDDELLDELEEALILSDLGPATSLKCRLELEKRAKLLKATTGEELKKLLSEVLFDFMCDDKPIDTQNTPVVILVIGVNGVGKTTTIGKLATRYTSQGKNVVLCAGDTFRAAASEQLTIWAERSGATIVKKEEGSDPASVVYDAIDKAKNADILIIDTAGRLHNKQNLMAELEKINRILEKNLPNSSRETLLALDATTGQNAVSQATEFSKVSKLTGIILTKLDGTAKGGIIIPISSELKIPVKLVGVGEGKDDLMDFNKTDFINAIFN